LLGFSSSFRCIPAGSIGQKSEEIVDVLFGINKFETPMKDLFSNIAHIGNFLSRD
jgi:hypothetical protein